MKKMCKVILAAAAIVVLAVPAMGADKLIVKNAAGTGNIFSVDDTGSTLVGTSLPNAFSWIKLYIASAGDTGFGVENFTDSSVNSAPGALFRRSRGTQTVPAMVKSAAQRADGNTSNDRLGFFLFGGYDGASWLNTGGLTARVDGDVSAGWLPTKFGFEVGGSTATRLERLAITSAGNIVAGNLGSSATADMATTVTNGFLYVPNVAGALTSCATATVYAGHSPIWYDTTNNKICSCRAGVQKCTAVLN